MKEKIKKINPKEYYYNYFRKDFENFVSKSHIHEHPGEGWYIPIGDLNTENLSHIQQDNRMLFIYSLTFTTLIDQVMYAHFKQDYPKFQGLTLYPKIELGITGENVNPWYIAQRGLGLTTFEKFAEFFVEDLKEFFNKQEFKEASWKNVKNVMLNDSDVAMGTFGEIFRKTMEEKSNPPSLPRADTDGQGN